MISNHNRPAGASNIHGIRFPVWALSDLKLDQVANIEKVICRNPQSVKLEKV